MKKEFLSIRILHAALVMGSTLFFAVVYFVLGTEGINATPGEHQMYNFLIPFLLVGSIVLARMLDRKRLSEFQNSRSLMEKMVDYRTRVIIRSALIEGAALMAVLALLETGSQTHAIYFGVGLLAMIYVRPYTTEFFNNYQLTNQEQQQFNQ